MFRKKHAFTHNTSWGLWVGKEICMLALNITRFLTNTELFMLELTVSSQQNRRHGPNFSLKLASVHSSTMTSVLFFFFFAVRNWLSNCITPKKKKKKRRAFLQSRSEDGVVINSQWEKTLELCKGTSWWFNLSKLWLQTHPISQTGDRFDPHVPWLSRVKTSLCQTFHPGKPTIEAFRSGWPWSKSEEGPLQNLLVLHKFKPQPLFTAVTL